MSKIDPIVIDQLDALLAGETQLTTVLANASALISAAITDNNWCGFYLYNEATGELDLGPFQGKVACMHIKPGNGVVGTAFAQQQAITVPDVHAFPGHIACDSASNSEVVVPISRHGQQLGVLDIDSPSLNRFSEEDAALIQTIGAHLNKLLDATA